jgi:hypothetical protein
MMNEYERVRNEGREAARNGLTSVENPYEPESPARAIAWECAREAEAGCGLTYRDGTPITERGPRSSVR